MSAEARARNLKRANEIRLSNAATRREIAQHDQWDGRLLAAELLRDPSPALSRLRVADLLKAIRSWGEMKSRRLCLFCGVSADRRIEALSSRQLDLAAQLLEAPTSEWAEITANHGREPAEAVGL